MKQEETMEPNKIVVFESKKFRCIWHNEKWFFSVVDVCGALTDSPTDLTARKYWNKLSQRLREEGSEVVTNCHRLKLAAKAWLNAAETLPVPPANKLKKNWDKAL